MTPKHQPSPKKNQKKSKHDVNKKYSCHHGHRGKPYIYSSSTSSESYEEKPIQTKNDETDYGINYPLKKVVFSFDTTFNTNSGKCNQLELDSNSIKLQSATDINDFPHKALKSNIKSNIPKPKASNNSDIISTMEFEMSHNYPGKVLVSFPSVKCQTGVSYEGAPHLVVPITQNFDDKKTTTYSKKLIDRKLDNEHYEFLENFDGHTEDTIESETVKNFNNRFLIKEGSPLTHFFTEDTNIKYSKSVQNEVYELRSKDYDNLLEEAKKQLSSLFGFSDITSEKFKICIKPEMDHATQSSLATQIKDIQQKIEKESKKTTDTSIVRNLNGQLNSLKAEGFKNFYMMNQQQDTRKHFDNFKKGMTFKFQGTITFNYLSVYNNKPIKNKKK